LWYRKLLRSSRFVIELPTIGALMAPICAPLNNVVAVVIVDAPAGRL
jgi:hypothetical protein